MTNENVAATTTTATQKKSVKLVYPAVPRNVSSISNEYIKAFFADKSNKASAEQFSEIIDAYTKAFDVGKENGSKNPTMLAINAMRRKFCEFFYPNLVAPKPKKQKKLTVIEEMKLMLADMLATA